MSPMDNVELILQRIREFRDERDWGQFHNPKDMAIAISLEAGELLEHFLWKGPSEVEARVVSHRKEIEAELADISIYLFELAENLGVDLIDAMNRKITINAEKYPVDLVRGSSKKYSEYNQEHGD